MSADLTEALTDAYVNWANDQETDIRIIGARSKDALIDLATVIVLGIAKAIAPEEQVASLARGMTDGLIANLKGIDWDAIALANQDPAPPPK